MTDNFLSCLLNVLEVDEFISVTLNFHYLFLVAENSVQSTVVYFLLQLFQRGFAALNLRFRVYVVQRHQVGMQGHGVFGLFAILHSLHLNVVDDVGVKYTGVVLQLAWLLARNDSGVGSAVIFLHWNSIKLIINESDLSLKHECHWSKSSADPLRKLLAGCPSPSQHVHLERMASFPLSVFRLFILAAKISLIKKLLRNRCFAHFLNLIQLTLLVQLLVTNHQQRVPHRLSSRSQRKRLIWTFQL